MRRFILLIMCAMASCATAFAQYRADDVPFNGMLMDGEGRGMSRVNVWIKGTERRTVTDKLGRFGLTNVGRDDVLVFTHRRMKVELPVEGRRSLNVMIVDERVVRADESEQLLNLGYGYIKRREYNANYNVITAEELRQSVSPDLETILMSRVAGMVYTNGEMTLRGRNSINLSSKPLILVDGTEVEDLSFVSVYDVESVTILKDGGMYGMRGANGVILVKTITP